MKAAGRCFRRGWHAVSLAQLGAVSAGLAVLLVASHAGIRL